MVKQFLYWPSRDPEVSRKFRLPYFEVIRLSALPTGRLNLPEIFLVLISIRV
jgi:hypothetical protein